VIEKPFWVEDHPRPPGLGTDDLPAEADVLVIGSGLTGVAAALRFAGAGKAVAVIDGGEIAGGASSINGGMVSPDVKAGIREVIANYGDAIGDEVWHASVRSVEIVLDLCREHNIDALANQSGLAALGLTAKDLEKFRKTAQWYRSRYGVDWEVLGPDRVTEVAGSARFSGALYEPEGFGIHPARYTFGLASALVAAGARLVANCPATAIARTPAGFDVTTHRGIIRAGDVIVATNGYTTGRPLPDLKKKVVSVGSYIIVTEPLLEPEAAAVFPKNAMTYTKRRLLHYMRRTPDNRILIGGRRNLKTDLPLAESAEDLQASLVNYFPQLAGREITHVWGGKLGVPFDLTPHMGQIDGVWYALGYAGHGVGLATLLGHDLAGMLLGEEPTSPFARIPHKGRFYYRGSPWFLSPASLLYRSLDRFGL
jgi:glycine/D-amino acid oxidase-like deaminating enzyme